MRVTFGAFTFDDATRELLEGARAVPLPPRAFDLLRVLLENRPRALAKSDLMEALWPKTFVSESNLAGLVNELRAALGDDARSPTWIRTVYGFGYAFAGAEAGDVPARLILARHRLLWGGREVALGEGTTTLGRDASADVLVADGSVSREHARIEIRGGAATLEDLGSKNGTWHDGTRVTSRVTLRNGDEIRIGNVSLVFVSAAADATTKTTR